MINAMNKWRNRLSNIKRKIGIQVSEETEETNEPDSESRVVVKRNNSVKDNNEDLNDCNNVNDLNYNYDDPFGYYNLFKFWIGKHVWISSSYEEYLNGIRHRKRKIIVWAHCIVSLISLIRFALLAIIDKPWIWTLFAEPTCILGIQHFYSSMSVFFGIMIFFIQSLITRHEINMKLELWSYFHRIRFGQNKYKLEDRYYRKFCKISKFLIKLGTGPLYRAGILALLIPYGILSIMAYFYSDMNLSITNLVLSNLLQMDYVIHGTALCLMGSIAYIVVSLHLKYHFKQIKDQIQECVKSGNYRHLIDTIHEHNYWSGSTQKLNEMFSPILGISYLSCTAAFDILLHMTLSVNNSFARLVYGLFALIVMAFLYAVIYSAASVTESAHDLTTDLYSFLLRNRPTIKQKLKIIAFIEKLSGPKIGFYCYHFFPLTYFEFYKYLFFVFSLYALLSGFVSKA